MRKSALLAASTCLITGCSQGAPGLRPLSYATPGEAQLFVSNEPCVHSPSGQEAFHLIPLIAATALSGLLDKFGTALEKGAEGGDLPTVIAMKNLSLLPGTLPSCFTMIRGAFLPETGDTTVFPLEGLIYDQGNPEQARRYNALGIPPIYRLDQYVEIELRGAPNNQAVTFFPRYALINRSLDGDAAGNRVLSIALKFSSPGAEDAGSVVLLSNMHVGVPFPTAAGRPNVEAPWFVFPNKKGEESATQEQNEDEKADAGKKGKKKPPKKKPSASHPAASSGITGGTGLGAGAVSSQQPPRQAVDPYSTDPTSVPMTVTVTTVETRPTNEALAFIASVFNGVKPKIQEQIGSKLNPPDK